MYLGRNKTSEAELNNLISSTLDIVSLLVKIEATRYRFSSSIVCRVRAFFGGKKQSFQKGTSEPVMLLSIEDSASGTNLTIANHVVLVHPMVAESEEKVRVYKNA